MKFLFIGFSLLGIIFFGDIKQKHQKPLYFVPPSIISYFSLGYRDFLADLMWLRFIQDADFCSFQKGIPTYTGGINYCKKGWSYRMVDAISELAPRFETVYVFSYVMLNVFTGDRLGSEQILLKGLKYFPFNWKLNFYASYFYFIDAKKIELATYYAYQAAKNGGPDWLYRFVLPCKGKTDKNISLPLGIAKPCTELNRELLEKKILESFLNSTLSEKKKSYIKKYLKKTISNF